MSDNQPLIDNYIPSIAMCIVAHPDDQEFSSAGTLAKWAQAGCQVISVIVTNGDAGSNDPQYGAAYKPVLADLRAEEQRSANAITGIQETVFLHYPDGILEPTLELRHELCRLIRKYKPDAVICGDPTVHFYGNSYMNHPDHRAAAQAACDAVFPSAGTRLIFTDLLEAGYAPFDVHYLYIHGSEHSNIWIDITSTIETKIKALQQHRSQIDPQEIEGMMKQWAAADGKAVGVPYAESYLKMVIKE